MIYKGCQKKIIMLKNPSGDMFEEAYFILKDETVRSGMAESDMVREANRILRESVGHLPADKVKKRGMPARAVRAALVWFACGLVCGIAASFSFIALFA